MQEENNENLNNQNNISDNETERKKPGRKPKGENDNLGDAQVLDYPNRTLPKLLEEVIEKDFVVVLGKDGYYIEGFYGLNPNMLNGGYVLAQDTTIANALALTDSKGNRHLVKTFEELVFFHSMVWGSFFKSSAEYKKPNPKWFPFLLEYGALNISPK